MKTIIVTSLFSSRHNPRFNYLSTILRRLMGEWKYSFIVLNLVTGWIWMSALHSYRFTSRGKSHRFLSDRFCRHRRHQRRSERCGGENNLLPMQEMESGLLGRRTRSLVAIPTELKSKYTHLIFFIWYGCIRYYARTERPSNLINNNLMHRL
jgi:hypothetical protein